MEEELASQMETIYSYCVVDSDSGIYFSRGVHFYWPLWILEDVVAVLQMSHAVSRSFLMSDDIHI